MESIPEFSKPNKTFPKVIESIDNNSTLNKFFGENDTTVTQVFIKDKDMDHMFKTLISSDQENHFCKRNLNFIQRNIDQMNQCKNCHRIVCSTCMEICHKDCTMHKTEDLFCSQVKLYYSFCECRHFQKEIYSEEAKNNYLTEKLSDIKKFNIRNYKFPCFISEKLNEIYKCKKKDFKKYLEFKDKDNNDNNYNDNSNFKNGKNEKNEKNENYEKLDYSDFSDLNDLPAYAIPKAKCEEIKFKKNFNEKIPKFVYLKNSKPYRIICQYCFINCEPKRQGRKFEPENYIDVDNNSEIQNPKCDCDHEAMSTHDDINLLMKFICYIFNNADDSHEFYYDSVMKKIENYLKQFYGDLNNTKEGRILVDYMLDSIKILSFIYKRNLIYEKTHEAELLDRIYNKIENIQENPIYFNFDRINLSLTYVFYFYKKNLFQDVIIMETNNMNLCSRFSRMNIHKKNSEKMDQLKNAYGKDNKLFDIKNIINIFKIINRFSSFSINLDFLPENNKNNEYPYVLYFFLMLVKSYCFSYDDIIEIKNFILETKIIFNNEINFNSISKKVVDEILYICQVFVIDYFLHEKDEEIKVKPWLIKREEYEKINLKEQLFFYQENFKSYFEVVFIEYRERSKAVYNTEDRKMIMDLTKKNILKYFDIFNNNFIPHIVLKNYENDEEIYKGDTFLEKFFQRNTIYNDTIFKKNEEDNKLKNAIGYFNNFLIPYHSQEKKITDSKEDIKQLEKNSCTFLLRCIKRIFNFQKIDLDKVINSLAFNEGEYLEYALTCLKRMNILKKNKLILAKYVDKPIEIDIINLDKRYHREDLLYLFYMIFIEELYRSLQFKIALFHWNFLIFLFLGNGENVEFLLREIKFFEFLLSKKFDNYNVKKSYLIKSLYNSSESQRNNNFIWRYFSFIFDHFIDEGRKLDSLKYLKDIILSNYINEIIEFYEILHIKRKNLMKSLNQSNENNLINTMNFDFIYNFLKIANSILIRKNPKDFNPFDYNCNKFETIEKLLIFADIAFSVNFKVKGYLRSFVEFMNVKSESLISESMVPYLNSENMYVKNNPNLNPNNTNSPESKIPEIPIKNDIEIKSNNPLINLEEKKNDEQKLSPEKKMKKLMHLKTSKIEFDKENARDYEDFKFIAFKKLNKHNVQYQILDILCSQTSIPFIETNFNIINHNINEFISFLRNREQLYESFKDNKNCYREIFFNLEKLIIRFLLNFLMIKIFNQKYNGFIDMGFKIKEMKELNSKNPIFKSTLDEGDNNITTRFLVNRMKIKIMNVLKEYFIANEKRQFLEEELVLPKLIFVNMFWIFKQNYLNMINNNQDNIFFQENFIEFFNAYIKTTHFNKYTEKSLVKIGPKKNINSENSEENNKSLNDEDIEIFKNILNDMSKLKISILQSDSRYSSLRFFDFTLSVGEYFNLYIKYENKRNNLFNIIIEKLITDEKENINKSSKLFCNSALEKGLKKLF